MRVAMQLTTCSWARTTRTIWHVDAGNLAHRATCPSLSRWRSLASRQPPGPGDLGPSRPRRTEASEEPSRVQQAKTCRQTIRKVLVGMAGFEPAASCSHISSSRSPDVAPCRPACLSPGVMLPGRRLMSRPGIRSVHPGSASRCARRADRCRYSNGSTRRSFGRPADSLDWITSARSATTTSTSPTRRRWALTAS